MKLVMTVLARNEADVIEANLRYHLERGVDFVVATDNGSVDGTRELLADYEREGVLHLIDEPAHDADYGPWRTRMARLAATEYGADWVINNDADEFWWPDRGTLKSVLEEIPDEYGILRAPKVNFVPRRGDGGFFADRLIVRGVGAPHRPRPKSAHRARPDITVGSGNHALTHPGLPVLGGWYPIQILHFPVRSYAQQERRIRQTTLAKRAGNLREKGYGELYRLLEQGELREEYERGALDEAGVEAAVAAGNMVVDLRLRDFFERHGRPPRRDLWTVGEAEPTEPPPVPPSAPDVVDVEREGRMTGSILQHERQLAAEGERLRREAERAEGRLDEERRRRKAAERRLKAATRPARRVRSRMLPALARRLGR